MNLSVNGSNQVVDAPGDTKLLWVIREHLRLTGTKFGCGLGLCGACTVHMNGEAVRSCQIELSDAEGTQITTIEGLGANGHHPVQKAWAEIEVPQCGYCQSGQTDAPTWNRTKIVAGRTCYRHCRNSHSDRQESALSFCADSLSST